MSRIQASTRGLAFFLLHVAWISFFTFLPQYSAAQEFQVKLDAVSADNIGELLPSGSNSEPVILYHQTSGMRLQSDGASTCVIYSSAPQGVPPGADSSSAFIFKAKGLIKHPASGKCLGTAAAAEDFEVGPDDEPPAIPVELVECDGVEINWQALRWQLTAAGSVKHLQSGFCIHPLGGKDTPDPGTQAILHKTCDNPRITFTPKLASDPPPYYAPEVVDPDLDLRGRQNDTHKSPACCIAEDCLVPRTGRNAFLTPVRTSQYVGNAKSLACSLAKTNPNSHLVMLGGQGDNLTTADLQWLHHASTPELSVEYLVVPDLKFPSYTQPRFVKNWIKLVAWNLTEYDAIIMLDSDMTVMRDLTHLFKLPTHVAWVPHQAINWVENSGGMFFVRPCKAVYEHMVGLIQRNRPLQFRDLLAEQTFLEWYFQYEGHRLSWEYNANPLVHGDMAENGTVTGLRPIVLHFADQTAWKLPEDSPFQKYANGCASNFPGHPPRQLHMLQKRMAVLTVQHAMLGVWHHASFIIILFVSLSAAAAWTVYQSYVADLPPQMTVIDAVV